MRSIAEHYGLTGERRVVVLLRVLAVLDDETRLPELLTAPQDDVPAPVLIMPRVFEPGFCDRLVAEYDRDRTPPPGVWSHYPSCPLGGAIVFSCSLLREATPVTAGRRYCTVPFLCDEAGEAVRMRNLSYVGQ